MILDYVTGDAARLTKIFFVLMHVTEPKYAHIARVGKKRKNITEP